MRSVIPCSPGTASPTKSPNWRTNVVHRDFHIHCLDALYSVPSHLCPPGQEVEVRVDSRLVRIYHRGQLIKTHPRQPKGGRSTDVDDYPPKIAPYTTRDPDGLKRDATKLGPAVGEFAQRLFQRDHPWAKLRQGHKLLRLGQRYTAQRLDAACQRALDVDLIDVKRVENILVQALERRPRPNCPCPCRPAASLGPDRSSHTPTRTARSQPEEEIISMTRINELTPLLKRLQLGPMAATLPGRIALARGATGLRLLPGDHPQRRGQPSRPPAH